MLRLAAALVSVVTAFGPTVVAPGLVNYQPAAEEKEKDPTPGWRVGLRAVQEGPLREGERARFVLELQNVGVKAAGISAGRDAKLSVTLSRDKMWMWATIDMWVHYCMFVGERQLLAPGDTYRRFVEIQLKKGDAGADEIRVTIRVPAVEENGRCTGKKIRATATLPIEILPAARVDHP